MSGSGAYEHEHIILMGNKFYNIVKLNHSDTIISVIQSIVIKVSIITTKVMMLSLVLNINLNCGYLVGFKIAIKKTILSAPFKSTTTYVLW